MEKRYEPYKRPNRGGRKASARSRGRAQALRMAACVVLLGAVMILRAFFPGAAELVRAKVLPMMEAELDHMAVIASIGETLTGEVGMMEVLGEIYIRAFGGIAEEVDAHSETMEATPSPEPIVSDHPPIEEVIPVPELPEGIPMPDIDIPEEKPETPAAVAVFLERQSEFADTAIPENVTFEYDSLGIEFVVPVMGPVSSSFGFRRHPLLREVRFHFGTDIAVYTGTPFVAFADGRVVSANENESWGKYILLYHGDGIYTRYAHADAKRVQTGDMVERGQRIGYVGMTGAATGPHLHFELRVNGKYRNPEFHMTF